MTNNTITRVLFVCLGNICRSPIGHGVLEHLAARRGLDGRLVVDSCGTSSYHVGERPNRHSTVVARKAGIDISRQRARQIRSKDFEEFDYILAMDRSNLQSLRHASDPRHHAKLHLLLDFGPDAALKDVPDPYYGGPEGFQEVFDLVERACEGFLRALEQEGRA